MNTKKTNQMKLKIIFLSLCVLSSQGLIAQNTDKNSPTIFCFGKNKVNQAELERGYLRNKDVAKNKPTVQDIEEYMKLYQNFKLKVQDAKDKKMDTLPEYVRELADYRRQLSRKYLSDSAVTEELIREAYFRTFNLVNASHILILSSYNDAPNDTFNAFKKLDSIKSLILKNSISFEQAAMSFSEDPSAKNQGSLGFQGNLGWFSAFQMLYEFEDMAYQTEKGNLSPLFRTRFGYHVLKVNDKKVSKGERKISQIIIKKTPNADAETALKTKQRITAIHQLLTNGDAWDSTMLKYTEDQNARYNGGMTDWFFETSADKLAKEVIEEAYNLSVKGQISGPIESGYAWHILFLVDQRPTSSFEDKEIKLRSSVAQDSRSFKSTEATIERIKKQNGFTMNQVLLNNFIAIAANDVLAGTWTSVGLKNGKEILYTVGNKKITLGAFSKFLEENQNFNPRPKSGEAVINNFFKSYTDNEVMTYEDANLEQKYPQFGAVYQDFKDGILFFNINSIEVWNKPMTDTSGLRQYYENNRDSFSWKERVELLSISAANHQIVHQAHDMLVEGMNKDSVMNALNISNPLNLLIERGLYEKGMNSNADKLLANKSKWANGEALYLLELPTLNGVHKGMVAIKLLPAGQKSFDDSRGSVAAGFQIQEEQKWLNGLRAKYKIKVYAKTYEAFKAKMLAL